MRIIDLLHPHLDGVTDVVDTSPAHVDLEPYLALPDAVHYRRTPLAEVLEHGPRPPGGELLVAFAPPVARDRAPLDAVLDLLPLVPDGGRALLLFGDEHEDLPASALLAALGSATAQIRRLLPFDYGLVRSGAIVERTHTPLPLLPPLRPGHAGGVAVDDDGVALRLANERQVLDFQVRALRRRAEDAGAGPPTVDGAAAGAVDDAARVRPEQHSTERHQLEGAWRATQQELAAAQRRVAALERSVAYQVGQALIQAAKSPGPGTLRLPRRLWSLYQARERGTAAQPAPVRTASALPGREHTLLQAHTAARLEPRRGLGLAGVWTTATAARLAPDCRAATLLPDDATLVLERVRPDAVLIQAGAVRAGQPWAHAGTTVGLQRDVQLRDLVAEARGMDVPVALWMDVPAHEAGTLRDLAPSCDVVVGEPGVGGAVAAFHAGLQLAVHHPVDLDPTRPAQALHVGSRDRRSRPADRALLDQLLRTAARTGLAIHEDPTAPDDLPWPDDLDPYAAGPLPWRRSAATYRRATVAIAGPARGRESSLRALEQLACGARLVGTPATALESELADALTVVAPGEADRVVTRLLAEGPTDATDARRRLRHLWPRHGTRRQLAALAAALGLDAEPRGGPAVAVATAVDPDRPLAPLVQAVLAQHHRPAEVLVAVGAPGDAARIDRGLEELRGAGLTVQVLVVADDDPARRVRRLARAAASPLVTWWGQGPNRHGWTLLDAVIALECSRAAAVGLVEAADDTAFVPGLPLEGALLRREDAADGDLPLDEGLRHWHRRGLRLFGVAPLPDEPLPAR